MYDFNKDAKIIIALRHPAERAYSHFLMDLSGGILESKDFIKEIERQENEKNRNIENDLYIERSLYAQQIKRYMDIFPKENIMIVFQEDFNRDTQKIMDEIFDFLDLDSIKIDIK
ncbi:MAG: sulfotransferase [Sulfurovaceae bacterium]